MSQTASHILDTADFQLEMYRIPDSIKSSRNI